MAGPLRAAGGLRARRRAPALAGGVRTPRGPGASRAEPAGEPGAAPPSPSGTEERLDAVLGGSGDEDEAAGPGAPRGYMEYYNETSNPFAAPAADAGGRGERGGGGRRRWGAAGPEEGDGHRHGRHLRRPRGAVPRAGAGDGEPRELPGAAAAGGVPLVVPQGRTLMMNYGDALQNRTQGRERKQTLGFQGMLGVCG